MLTGKVRAVVTDSKEFSVKTINYLDVEKKDSAPLSTWGTEVYFMSSGTSESVKLCAYTAESFYYQVLNTTDILKRCPQIKSNYKGHIKLLMLLPLYHIFGFVAVYLWFGFFARTFVFLKDLSAQTLLSAVKKHEVTHIFAVPMVWEKVYKEALKKIRARGEETYNKFTKAATVISKKEALGKFISKVAFKEIREGLFGESIRFFISGGSAISKEALEFFNAIGYFAVNGYGATELAITSVETSKKRKERNLASIGAPFSYVDYKIEEGELKVKSKGRAYKILADGKEEQCCLDDWFNTNDLASVVNGRYYLHGRKDDLIVLESGENINPQVVEDAINIDGVVNKVLIKENGKAVLVLEINGWMPVVKLKEIEKQATNALIEAKVQTEVKKIVLTRNSLLDANDFKLSRKKVLRRLKENQIVACDMQEKTERAEESELEQELISILTETLDSNVEIYPDSNFFIDLDASSLDYFSFIIAVKDKFNLSSEEIEGKNLVTIKDFANEIIKKHK